MSHISTAISAANTNPEIANAQAVKMSQHNRLTLLAERKLSVATMLPRKWLMTQARFHKDLLLSHVSSAHFTCGKMDSLSTMVPSTALTIPPTLPPSHSSTKVELPSLY